jgi:tetratricopeptide (TPR) repeat protein
MSSVLYRAPLALLILWLGNPLSALAHPAPDETLRHHDNKVAAAPEDYRPHLERASFLIHEGRIEDSAADLAAIERLAPQINTGYFRGILAIKRGDNDQAIAQLNRFIAEFPNHPEAHVERGRAYRSQGNNANALDDLVAAATLQRPINPGLVIEAATLARVQGDTVLAIALADQASAASAGPTPQLQLFVVDTLAAAGRHDEALARLQKLLAASPTNPEWQLRQAKLLIALDRTAEAQAVLADAQADLAARKPTPWRNKTLATIHDMQINVLR